MRVLNRLYPDQAQHKNLYKMMYFFSLKIVFILANSADPDEMLPYVAFHQGLPCLPN